MPLTVVLALGVESALLANHGAVSQSAGCQVTSAGSIREAIVQLKNGHFDLILLDHSIPVESRERLTFLIRASSSTITVVSVRDAPGVHDSFADATIRNEPDDLLRVIGELWTKRGEIYAAGEPCTAE